MNPLIQPIYDLLSDPARWTRGANARVRSGNPIGPNEANAVCWCIAGAICKVWPDKQATCMNLLYRHFPDRDPVGFNDNPATTHADLLARLAAIP